MDADFFMSIVLIFIGVHPDPLRDLRAHDFPSGTVAFW